MILHVTSLFFQLDGVYKNAHEAIRAPTKKTEKHKLDIDPKNKVASKKPKES